MNEEQNNVSLENTNQPVTETPSEVFPEQSAPVAPTIETPIETPTEAVPSEPIKPNKKGKIIIPIIIGVILIILGIGVFLYLKLSTSGINIANKTIDNIFDQANDTISLYKKYKLDELTNNAYEIDVKAEADLDAKISGQKYSLKDAYFDFDTVLNYKNEEISASISIGDHLKNDRGPLDLDILSKNNGTNNYIKSNIYEEVLSFDSDKTLFTFSSINFDDYTKIIEKTRTYVKASIKAENISQESGVYKLDNLEVKGLKTRVGVDKETTLSILKSMKDDSEFVQLLAKVIMEDESKATSILNDEIDIVKDSKDEVVYFDIYTSKLGKFYGIKLISKDNEELTYVVENNTKKITIKNDYYSIIAKKSGSETELALTYGTVTINVKAKETVAMKKLSNTIVISIDSTDKSIEGNISINAEIKEAANVKTFDTSNAVDIMDLTEFDELIIYMNLQNTAVGRYIEYFNNMFGDTPSLYDYNEDDLDLDLDLGFDLDLGL